MSSASIFVTSSLLEIFLALTLSVYRLSFGRNPGNLFADWRFIRLYVILSGFEVDRLLHCFPAFSLMKRRKSGARQLAVSVFSYGSH